MRNKCIFSRMSLGSYGRRLPLLGQSFSEDEFRWGSRPYFPDPANAIRVQSNFVQVPVVVRDSDGKAVGGFRKYDFELFDNGRQVEIASFNVESVAQTVAVQPHRYRQLWPSLRRRLLHPLHSAAIAIHRIIF